MCHWVAVLIITYLTMKQMDLDHSPRHDYSLWLPCISIKTVMKNQHMLSIIVRFHW